MEIWLKQEGARFRIPVLPAEYTVASAQNNTTVSINALGEINLLGKRGLREISFSSFFPCNVESYCEYSSFPSPKECVSILERMKRKGNLRLLMTGTGICMDCTIESLEYGENDGTGDIRYTTSLKEYVTLCVTKSGFCSQLPVTTEPSRLEKTPEGVEAYTVKRGDCLSSIARIQTGSSSNWRKIYSDNQGVIGADPNRIAMGMVLMIKLGGDG